MMAEPWRVTLMGCLHAERGGHTITRFKYQKVGGLLAYLAYHRKQMHGRELLVEIFWPYSDPEAGRANLSVALSSLRNQFEPPGMPAGTVLRADRYSVGMHPTALTTDAAEFQETLQAAARHPVRSSERAEQLVRAVELYQGPLLPGFYEAWIRPEQERLSGLFFDAVSALLALREEGGDLAEALRLARHAVAVDPLREEAHQQLIRLLAAMGQPGAALRQYKELEWLLEEELGAEPSAPLRALARRIERDSGLAAPPLSTLPAPTLTPRRDLDPALARLPETVTFLLTDIEGSTRLWERTGDAFRAALERHHRALRALFVQHGGQELKEAGGSFLVGFGSASKALACAAAAQLALARQEWSEPVGVLKVRMALHTGEVERSEDGEYHGLVLNRAARMLAAAHGGQILVGEATACLLRAHMPADTRLVDLGVFRLRDVPTPERLYQAEYPEMPTEPFAPPAAEPGLTGHLPLLFTRFFGRESEITDLLSLLTPPGVSGTRLVTLTGTGGTGKTRLAIAVAERLVEAYRGAVWFVPLADLSDPARIDDAILDTLRLPRSPQREPREQVIEYLARQPSLLILDNFEHLLTAKTEGERGSHPQVKIENPSGGSQIVQDYLARVPSLVCLVTSRQVLGLTGEREFAVAPLPTPNGPDSPERLSLFDSVQLFLDRAQQAMPHFQVTNHNAAAVAELCQRLEGIPLSIELAAARALVLTPAQMLAQLERRFDLLASRKRDVAERQRSLRAAIDWSYRLLTPELQRFFARLSVFRGGWSVEAAEAVCEAPLALDYLAELREGSLVLSEESGQGMRFRMLETLREYAQEWLAEAVEVAVCHKRHADYFLNLAEQAEPELQGPDQVEWLDKIEAEHDNIRTALDWALRHDPLAGLRLAGALAMYWMTRAYGEEGRLRWLNLMLGAQPEETADRARALLAMGLIEADFPSQVRRYEQALAIYVRLGDERGIADGHLALALSFARQDNSTTLALRHLEECLPVYRRLGDLNRVAGALKVLGIATEDPAEAKRHYAESLAILQEIGDLNAIQSVYNNLGILAASQGDDVSAITYYEQCVNICRQLRNRWWLPLALGHLAAGIGERGDLRRARELVNEALDICKQTGDVNARAHALERAGLVAYLSGAHAEARESYREALKIRQARDPRSMIVVSLVEAHAMVAAATGNFVRATHLLACGEAAGTAIGAYTRWPRNEERVANARDLCVTALGSEAFAQEWVIGRSMSLEEAIAYALEESDA